MNTKSRAFSDPSEPPARHRDQSVFDADIASVGICRNCGREVFLLRAPNNGVAHVEPSCQWFEDNIAAPCHHCRIAAGECTEAHRCCRRCTHAPKTTAGDGSPDAAYESATEAALEAAAEAEAVSARKR